MPTPSPTTFRALVLPREHGSWSLAFEPVALGLLVAPSPAGAWLALAVAAAFFVRRPLKLALTLPAPDARRAAAWRWVAIFGVAALGTFTVSTNVLNPQQTGTLLREHVLNTEQSGWSPLWPLLLALPCGIAFLWFDLRGEMREAEAELAGSAAFACVPATLATLAGWSASFALALTALALARSLPTVLVVRAFLRRAKGQPAGLATAALITFAALAVVLTLGALHHVPFLAVPVAFVFFARSLWLLSPLAPDWPARRVGLLEAILGAVALATLAWAYRAM